MKPTASRPWTTTISDITPRKIYSKLHTHFGFTPNSTL